MILTQAVMNVTGKERYAVIPDEVIRYALGRFGRPMCPSRPRSWTASCRCRARASCGPSRRMAALAELRRRIGASFRRGIPAARDDAGELVDAMQAAGPAARTTIRRPSRVMELLCAPARAARPVADRAGEAGIPAGAASRRAGERMKRAGRRAPGHFRNSPASCSTSTARWC